MMDKQGLVPEVIPVLPKNTVQVEYGVVQVRQGNELTPTQVKDKPTKLTWTADPNIFYTLILSDPDISPQLNFKQCQHWLVVNIPGNDLSKGDTVFEYFGSGPPQGTGIHRYAFIVFKQPGKIGGDQLQGITDNKIEDRKSFTAVELADKFKLGHPVAANFFRAQYDDYVPIVHQTLRKKYNKE